MATVDLQIERMHCGACIRKVTQVLNALPSTHAETVALGSARVQAAGDPAPLLEALANAGFPTRVTNTQP